MKTYIFIFIFLIGSIATSLAAQDESYTQMNGNPSIYTTAANGLEAIQKEQAKTLSWKEKVALKIAIKKLTKAERKIKKAKDGGLLGGVLAILFVGVLLTIIGAFILVPLLIIGIILLALGIVGSVFRGLGSIFW